MVYLAKTEALISCVVTAQLICTLCLQKGGFLMMELIYMSRVMRKLDFCICKNKAADQLCGNREADQRLCFRYIDSTIPLLPIFQASSHIVWLYSLVWVGPGQKP